MYVHGELEYYIATLESSTAISHIMDINSKSF